MGLGAQKVDLPREVLLPACPLLSVLEVMAPLKTPNVSLLFLNGCILYDIS